jgi:hypothetical protein
MGAKPELVASKSILPPFDRKDSPSRFTLSVITPLLSTVNVALSVFIKFSNLVKCLKYKDLQQVFSLSMRNAVQQ